MRATIYKYWLVLLLTLGMVAEGNAQLSISNASINSCTGSISISVVGGVGPYSYVWSFSPPGDGVTFTDTGLSTSSFFNQISGHYRVVVTDANNNTVSATYQISDSNTITANIKFAGLVCVEDPSSGVIILTFNNGTPPFSWELLDNNNGLQLVNFGGDLQTNFILINQDTNGDRLGVGDYRFKWSDVNGCSGIIANILITEPSPTNLTINTETGVTCFGDTDGVVNLTVTDGYGANYTVAIVAVGAPEPTLGDYINIGGGGSYTVPNLPTGDYRAYYFDRLSLPPFTTTYGLDVTDYNTCQKSEPFTISSPAELLINDISGELLSCFGDADGNITGTISGGTAPYTITLDPNVTQIVVNMDGDSFDFSGLSVGDYTFSITDFTGCTTNAQASITEPNLALTASIDSFTNVLCNGDTTGNITVAVVGGTPNYTITIAGPTVVVAQNNGNGTWSFNALSAGSYTISVSDQNGCAVANFMRDLTEPTAIIVAANVDQVVCNSDADGAVNGNISGGVAPYTITLVETATTKPVALDGGSFDFSGLTAGTYNFNIEDSTGCKKTFQGIITEPDPIAINALLITPLTCNGNTSGKIAGTIIGGIAPYTISLNTSINPTTFDANTGVFEFTGLQANTYEIIIIDASGCDFRPDAIVTEPDTLTPTFISFQNASCKGISDGSITISVTGGTAPYSFDVDGNPTVPTGTNGNEYTFGNLGARIYTITVTDINGCNATNFVQQTVSEPDLISISLDASQNISCFGDSDGFITVRVSGGNNSPNYTFTITGPTTPNAVDNGDDTWTFPGLLAGNYTIMVTDVNGCVSNPVQIDQTLNQPVEIIYTANKGDISCFGLTDGIITVTDYNPAYTYVLVNTAAPGSAITSIVQGNNLVYLSLPEGEYSITASIAGNNGVTCTSETLLIINEPTEILLDSSTVLNYNAGTGTPIQISCNGASDGEIDITIIGGTGTYTYLWTTGDGNIPGGTQNNQNLNGLTAGTYSVLVSDQNNAACNKVFNFILNEPRALTNNAVVNQSNICFSGDIGSVISTILNNGSVDGITYTYTITGLPALPGTYPSIQTTTALEATFTNLPAGDFTVQVVDENGCVSNSNTVTVTQPSNPISITSTMSDYFGFGVECNGDTNGTITLNNITGGTPNGAAPFYTVSWTGPNGFVSSSSNLTNLEAGAYSLTITDANGCEYLESFEITEPDVLTLSGTPSDYNGFGISGNGLSNGSIDITTTGGTSNYIYDWTTLDGTIPAGQETGKDLTGLVAGTYTVLITDENGCTISESWTLTKPDLLLIIEVTASHVNNLCFGDTNGVIEVSIAQQSVSPYDYILTISAGGAIVAQVDNLIATNYIFSSLPAGTYTVTVRDANNNTDTLTDIIISEPPSALLVNSIIRDYNGFQVECNGESNGEIAIITSGGAPNYTFAWTTTNGIIPAGQEDDESLTGLVAGTYRLNVEDANGCTYQEDFIISEPSQLLITTNNADNISCNSETDGRILITPSGGTGFFTYAWTKDNITYATTEDITGLGAGEYILTLSDTNNCTAIANYTIIEPAPIVIIVDAGVDILCNGGNTGAIDLTINGGTLPYAYSWTKDGNPITETTQGLSNQTAGTYEVTVTDASGCSVNETIVLTESTEIVVSYTKTKISCYNANDGTMNVTLSGGLSPYTFTWSDLGNGLNRANLGPGIYTITVTDANGCIKAEPIEIIDAPVFEINPTVTNITCFGADDGTIELNINGGVAPLVVTWADDASAGIVRNNLTNGTYTVNILDATGCSINSDFIINEPGQIVLDAIITNATACHDPNTGAIDLQITGGTAPYTISWSNGTSTEDLLDINANDYTATVTDSQGCQEQQTFTVTRPAPIELEVRTTEIPDCDTKSVVQRNELIISGGVAPYAINWSSGTVSGSNGEIMETEQNGTIIVNITDSLGCTKEIIFDVALSPLGDPNYDYTSLSFTSFGTLSVNDPITFINTSTETPIRYTWDFGDGTLSTEENPIHSFLTVGSYTVSLTTTYPYGCSYTYSQTLELGLGYSIMVPNGFTPNGDGINDTIRPVFTGMNQVQMSVYDTWGAMVYTESGVDMNGWDGTINGSGAENGNYSMVVQAVTFNGVVINENKPIILIK